MARRLASKPIRLEKERDESHATEEATKGGPFGRGNPKSAYMCSACESNDHKRCESMKLQFCGCYRCKHKDPKRNGVKGLMDGIGDNKTIASTTMKKKGKHIEDEFEWEDV